MKKLITFLFAAGLVTAASAQSGSYRNGYRGDNNSYHSSPYSNQYDYSNRYDGYSQWNDRRDLNRYERRRLAERRRYEMMMMRRSRAHYNDRRYYGYPSYGYSGRPTLQLSIGIGGRR
jgi:pullulanase/glycogen debranching enzyme